jgi:L-asparagine oxygenase
MLTIDAPASLTSRVLEQLLALKTSPYSQFEDFLRETTSIFEQLPEQIGKKIRNFKTDTCSPKALLMRNLPVDAEMPETPGDPDQPPAKQTFVSEGCLLGIGQFMGQPFGYAEERGGDIIRTIVPSIASKTSMSGVGSEVPFQLHTEIAWDDFLPHYIALYCLRGDPQKKAATCIAECRKALSSIPRDDLSVLREPRFQLGAPESFRRMDVGTAEWSKPQPIVTGPDSLPEMRVNFNFVRFLDRRAEEAFNKLSNALTKVTEYFYLEPGDLLVIDNRKAAHGRTSFNPSFDGRDRWLQQIYLHENLRSRLSTSLSPRVFSISR